LIGGAEHKDNTTSNGLLGIRIGELVFDDGEFIVLFGQRGIRVAPPFLFDGQVAGSVPG
jgi:hypothetical protein